MTDKDLNPQDSETSFISACLKAFQQQAFYNTYRKTFDVIRADTDEQKEKAFRLRYQVYCKENRFLEGATYVDGLEKDIFDSRAVHHLLIHKESGDAVGGVRVLVPNEKDPLNSFELQNLCDHPLLQIENRIANLCEISRFFMIKDFRRRPRDGHLLPSYYEQEWHDDGNSSFIPFFRRRIPYAPLGLMAAAFETALASGLTSCIMALESKQFHTLRRMGFHYRVLGPRIEMHGVLQPLVFNIKAVLDGMRLENPECWEVVSDKGRLQERANALYHYDWQDSVFDEICHDMILRKLI